MNVRVWNIISSCYEIT